MALDTLPTIETVPRQNRYAPSSDSCGEFTTWWPMSPTSDYVGQGHFIPRPVPGRRRERDRELAAGSDPWTTAEKEGWEEVGHWPLAGGGESPRPLAASNGIGIERHLDECGRR